MKNKQEYFFILPDENSLDGGIIVSNEDEIAIGDKAYDTNTSEIIDVTKNNINDDVINFCHKVVLNTDQLPSKFLKDVKKGLFEHGDIVFLKKDSIIKKYYDIAELQDIFEKHEYDKGVIDWKSLIPEMAKFIGYDLSENWDSYGKNI